MNIVRTTLFCIFFVLVTVLEAIPAVFLVFFGFEKPFKCLCLFWCKCFLVLGRVFCGVRYEVHGEENIPNGRFLAVSKHLSMWETIFFAYYFKMPIFILKKELFSTPIVGRFIKLNGMIGIDRNRPKAAIVEILSTLPVKDNKRPVIIFPQGTRVLYDKQYSLEKYPYKKGFLAIAKNLNLNILPISLNSSKFWGRGFFSIKKPGKIVLQFHKNQNTSSTGDAEIIGIISDIIECETLRIM